MELKFKNGDIVYLVTDPDQYVGVVTGITIRQVGILYGVSRDGKEVWCYDFELSRDKNILI